MIDLEKSQISLIYDYVNQIFPNWQGFSDPRFEKEEVTYKQLASQKVKLLLKESDLLDLIHAGKFTDLFTRIEKAAQAGKNLLFLSVVQKGDLSILFQADLDKGAFSQAFVDLLYGSGSSVERLERYLEFVIKNKLPNKWVFPTYFLFMCHPESDLFIKPTVYKNIFDLLKLTGWSSTPSTALYSTILTLASELKTEFSSYGPRDLIDIQSLIWVVNYADEVNTQQGLKKAEFKKLFAEFVGSYIPSKQGKEHLLYYSSGRQQAHLNLAEVERIQQEGGDVTDAVLLKFMPYVDTSRNREAGAWVHVAPSINGDLKKWFENSGWVQPGDWPEIALLIFNFVHGCVGDPSELTEACQEFVKNPLSKGFQTGMLTPILNALRPDEFILINNKSRQVLNHFLGTQYIQSLSDYPKANSTAKIFIEENLAVFESAGLKDALPGDVFDMFCHWLVAVKKFFRTKSMTAPFSKMFSTLDEANWAFDLLQIAANNLELLDEDSPLLAISSRPMAGGNRFHFNYGNWLVLGIEGTPGGITSITMALLTDQIQLPWSYAGKFTTPEHEESVTLYGIPIQEFRDHQDELLDIFSETLKVVKSHFVSWKKTPYKHAHIVKLAEAVFDEQKREKLFAEGLEESSKDPMGDTPPGVTRYWKIAPGENAWNWDACLAGGYITIGWEETGDVSGLTKEQFDKRTAELLVEFPDWGPKGVEQVWDFSQIQIGDRIVANRGTKEVLGIGTVTGPYLFIPEIIHGHHLPVEWEDTQVRPIKKGHWVRTMIELTQAEFEEIVRIEGESKPLGRIRFFDERSFILLQLLHDNSTLAVYNENKQDCKDKVEQPFQNLMLQVAENLRTEILEVMETEKNLFSRFNKNDYGRKGVWDFYWGAFYPKGGKRTSDPQLSLWINYQRLEIGFYIGDYGEAAKARFARNCRENAGELMQLLRDVIQDPSIVIGGHEDITINQDGSTTANNKVTWTDWLNDPRQVGFDLSVILPRAQVIKMTADQLVELVVKTYERFFPFIILATSDSPMEEISKYLGIVVDPVIQKEFPIQLVAEETGFEVVELQRWVKAIHRKRQVIIYGPPGTGKTYLAERLAKHLIGGGDGFSQIIQFHPEVSYEDFIQGIRPQSLPGGGLHYPIVSGKFLNFCSQAGLRSGICVLIIDEINRANLARVFGELMYLLEYREKDVELAAGGKFSIPDNVRIIGTMNTADRSIALVDHALRRRFAFLPLYPNYSILENYHEKNNPRFNFRGLIEVLISLNGEIKDKHYQVGVSYFLIKDIASHIEDIWKMEIEPYLEEFFFDQEEKYKMFVWEKISEKIFK